MRKYWLELTPSEAANVDLPCDDVIAPVNEAGEECPWPWETQQRAETPMGQYYCVYCGTTCVAGVAHPDFGVTVLATGSRAWSDRDAVLGVLGALPELLGVAPRAILFRTGAARGLDTIAHGGAVQLGMRRDPVPANWKRDGRKKAGPIRNQAMVDRFPQPTLCLAFPHPRLDSRGTRDCMARCERARIPVWEYGVTELAAIAAMVATRVITT